MKGLFITFEGIDGSGKSTQVKLLAEYFVKQGYQPVVTREPGGTKTAEQIRQILLNPDNNITDRTEVLLYAAARAQHVEELIAPSLEAGRIVICDRFIDSTMAYQGFGRGLSLPLLNNVNTIAAGGVMPDLTLIIDLSPEEGMERIIKTRCLPEDRLEKLAVDFHRRVRQGYLELAKDAPDRITVLDGSRNKIEIFEQIKIKVEEYLNESGRIFKGW